MKNVIQLQTGRHSCGHAEKVNHPNPFAPRAALPQATRQIKEWVREIHALDDEVVVSTAELACRDDGCPDIETVIGIMRPGEKVRTIRIHKPIVDITREDVAAEAAASG